MVLLRSLAAAALGLVAAVPAAQAAVISFSDTITPAARTDYTRSLSFDRFNPALGTLQSISFALSGLVVGTTRVESEDEQPATVTENLRATITLQRPNGSSLAVVIPFEDFTNSFTSYDGVTDFAGTSGITRSNVTAEADTSVITSTLEDLTLFTGTTDIVLPVAAAGSSVATGSGNLVTAFSTFAGASATVSYTYAEAAVPPPATEVPDPSALALLGTTLLGLGLMQRRR